MAQTSKMKLYLLAVFLVLVNASFVDFLESLQHHSSFQRLPEEEKLLFGELVLAAESNGLTVFIDDVGLMKVLKLMDRELRSLSFLVTWVRVARFDVSHAMGQS